MPRGVPGSGASRKGKPTLLDENIIRQFCALAQLGLGRTTIAYRMGLVPRTVFDWFERGKKAVEQIEKGKPVPNGELYAKLYTEWKKACATAEENAVRGILAAGQRQWQANAWWLERKCPERWADRGPLLREADKKFQELVERFQKATEGNPGNPQLPAPGE